MQHCVAMGELFTKRQNFGHHRIESIYRRQNINVAQMMISVLYRQENIVGKGEKACYQHFLLFTHCLQKASFLGVVKSRDCVENS